MTPHPRRDENGHSRGLPEPHAHPWSPDDWATLELWLFGVDLYNYGFWWESHEQLEALWLAAGRTSPHARFVQGLIKIAAAHLNLWIGKERTAIAQAAGGVEAMSVAARASGEPYMGVNVSTFMCGVDAWLRTRNGEFPRLLLAARSQ